MDVGHYEIILDHLLWVPSIAQINPIFCGTIKPTIFTIYFDTLGVRYVQFRNQSVLAIWMWVTTKSF